MGETERNAQTQGLRATPSAGQGWGRRWLQALKAGGRVEPLSRGRASLREGEVRDVAVGPGRVTATVVTADALACEVRLEVEVFDHLQWRRLVAALRDQPLGSARLLAGEVPNDVEALFTEVGTPLLPGRDLSATCSCRAATACVHVAAVCHALAARLDDDPFVLFALRGRTRAQLLAVLRPGGAAVIVEAPLPVDPRRFYGEELEGFDVDCTPPQAPAAVLARLGGPAPEIDGARLRDALAPAYAWIAAQASRIIAQ